MDEEKHRKVGNIEDPDSGHDTKYHRVEPVDRSENEEYAAEITSDDHRDGDRDEDGEVISLYGWIGLALSVISFFTMPIILGAAGIIFGFVSRAKGADMLGNIAIAAGAISILISLFILPFV